jgi:hypothetical protein
VRRFSAAFPRPGWPGRKSQPGHRMHRAGESLEPRRIPGHAMKAALMVIN